GSGLRGRPGSPAPRGGRARGPPSASRMPDGHLPHVSLPEGQRHGGEAGDRRRVVRPEHHDPDLRLRAAFRSHPGALTPSFEGDFMPSADLPLSRFDVDAIETEPDALRAEITADLSVRDAQHIRRMIRFAELSAVAGRALLMVGIDPL